MALQPDNGTAMNLDDDKEALNWLREQIVLLTGEDDFELAAEMPWEDIPEFDSFRYVNLIALVEVEAGVSFGAADVEAFKSPGELLEGIRRLR